MDRFLSSAGGSSASGTTTCGEPTCTLKSILYSYHTLKSILYSYHNTKNPVPLRATNNHDFRGPGIGEEGYGQRERECTDCSKRTAGDKTDSSSSSSSPMEADEEHNEQQNSRRCLTAATSAELLYVAHSLCCFLIKRQVSYAPRT